MGRAVGARKERPPCLPREVGKAQGPMADVLGARRGEAQVTGGWRWRREGGGSGPGTPLGPGGAPWEWTPIQPSPQDCSNWLAHANGSLELPFATLTNKAGKGGRHGRCSKRFRRSGGQTQISRSARRDPCDGDQQSSVVWDEETCGARDRSGQGCVRLKALGSRAWGARALGSRPRRPRGARASGSRPRRPRVTPSRPRRLENASAKPWRLRHEGAPMMAWVGGSGRNGVSVKAVETWDARALSSGRLGAPRSSGGCRGGLGRGRSAQGGSGRDGSLADAAGGWGAMALR